MKQNSDLQSELWLVLLLSAIGVYFGIPSDALNDPGLGWHIRTGQLIASTRSIPYEDPFLWKARAWVSDQWLSDVALYFVYNLWGLKGLVVGLTIFFSAVFLFFTPILLTKERAGLPAALLGAFVSWKLVSVHFVVRPVVFSFLFFLILKVMLTRKIRGIPDLFCLGGLFVVWANMHPSFILGLFLLGLYLASLVLDRFLEGGESASITDRGLMALIISTLSTLVNPYGYELHNSILKLGMSSYFMKLNQEWLPLTLREPEGQMLVFWLAVVVCTLFFFGRKKLGLTIFEFISTIIFSAAALYSVRYLPYAGILLGGVVARVACFGVSSVRRKMLYILLSGAIVAFCVAGVVLPAYLSKRTVFSEGANFEFSKERFPKDALDFILSRVQSETVVLNHPDIGGFLILMGKGLIRPVIDDRNTLNGEESYRYVLSAYAKKISLIEAMKRFNASYAIVPSGDATEGNVVFKGEYFWVVSATL